jgi:hypothetical protein
VHHGGPQLLLKMPAIGFDGVSQYLIIVFCSLEHLIHACVRSVWCPLACLLCQREVALGAHDRYDRYHALVDAQFAQIMDQKSSRRD